MRIGIAQLWQETNTFNPRPTTQRDFDQFRVLHGREIIEQLAETNEPGGFIQALRTWPERPEMVGLVRIPAWPGGLVTSETCDWIREEIVAALRSAGPLDGLLIALHGAMAGDKHPDVEGEFLEAVRSVVGPKLPLVATLDLHANVTAKMFQHADVLVVYHTAPHTDLVETGIRGAGVLRRLMIDGVKPVTAWCKLPMVPPVERANTQDPASISFTWRERLQALEKQPNVLSAGLATVQPWLDVPEFGSTVWITTAGDADFAKQTTLQFAQDLWNRRDDYRIDLATAADAVRQAHEIKDGLVVLSDAADATTSGAPGDSTWLLRELMKYSWPRGAAVTMVAPEVVEAAKSLGEGRTITMPIGGRRDSRFSQPAEITAVVERLFDAQFVMNAGHLGRNLPVDFGPSAVLRVGDVGPERSRGVRIVVTSQSGPHFAPQLFQTAGIDPFALNVLIAKSPCGFRASYAAKAAKIIVVRAPGCAPPDFWNYEYHHIQRPLWPWDDITDWQPTIRFR